MTVTGAGPGMMQAGMEDAGVENLQCRARVIESSTRPPVDTQNPVDQLEHYWWPLRARSDRDRFSYCVTKQQSLEVPVSSTQ